MDEEFIFAVKMANSAAHKAHWNQSDRIYELDPHSYGQLMNLIRVCQAHIKATTPEQVKHD